ncbi:MAG: hypothetical protein ACRC18_06675 [Cetobacterium sp.]
MRVNHIIETIEGKYGKIIKSEFTLAFWIHQSNYFIYQAKKFGDNKSLKKLYIEKNHCAAMMLESCSNIKLYKPVNDTRRWLIVLQNELEGYKYNIVVPYLLVKDRVNVSELELTDNNKDEIYVDGVEFRLQGYANKGLKLQFCLDNMKKSRLKMIEKINSNNVK